MGIPLYFKTIMQNSPEVIKDIKYLENIDRLFLDLNCAIHPCCRRITSEGYNPEKKKQIENKMITEIKKYIELIVNLVKPDFLYIAIDGVAPSAKMSQQRLRRYKKFLDQKLKNNVKSKLNMDIENEWDTNSITPGTDFMFKLSQQLNIELKENQIYNNMSIIFSDSNVAGEGEHKIFNYIKSNNNILSNDIIYGLDADLIMLSLASNKSNIYLLRESLEFGKMYYESGYKFLLLDIDELKINIISDVKSELFSNTNYNNQCLNENRFVDDYVFCCFILGNDFLPHMVSVDLRYNGIDIILNNYCKVYADLKEHLIDIKKMYINQVFLEKFLEEIKKKEHDTLIKISNKRNKIRPMRKDDEYEKQMELINSYPILNLEEENKINFESSGWQKRYYKISFNTSSTNDIEKICYNYLEGLIWTFKYYFDKCPSWEWKYEFQHPPLLEDLYKYIINQNINEIKMKKTKPNTPFQQLLCVLPKNSMNLLPKSYQKLMTNFDSEIKEYYPEDYKLDILFKRYFWQCQPILPNIDINLIRNSTKKCVLSSHEENLNDLNSDKTIKIIKGTY